MAVSGLLDVNKRQARTTKSKALKDTYFLINWLEDSEDDLFDVVSAKSVVPPEDVDIFDVVPEMACRVSFRGGYFKAKVIDKGSNVAMKKKQKEIEKGMSGDDNANKNVESADESDGSNIPMSQAILTKGSGSDSFEQTPQSGKEDPIDIFDNSDSDLEMEETGEGDSDSHEESRITVHSTPKSSSLNSGKILSQKKLLDSTHRERQRDRFLGVTSELESPKGHIRKKQKIDLLNEARMARQLEEMNYKMFLLEEKTKRLNQKLKQQSMAILRLQERSSHSPSSTCTSETSMTPTCKPSHHEQPHTCTPEHQSIPGDPGNVLICGHKVDRLKLQAVKVQTDPSKCALQLMSCLFSAKELVNGNPSGHTNSKNESRKQTIKRLDPERIKYISDYIEQKWPNSFDKEILKKMTQKCTDFYHSRKDLRELLN